MESVISKELDYKKVNYIHPTYRMNRIYAQSGSTGTTVTSAGGNETIYEIPIAPFNLSKSYFTFSATIPTPANFIYIYRDVFSWFRQFQIYTRSGIYLMDLNELANYTKVVWKPELSLLEFLDLDTDTPAISDVKTTGASAMLQRTNATTSATADRPTGGTAEIKADNVITSANSLAYTEPRYLTINATGEARWIKVHLPLRLLKNTICAIDKDIYVGEVLQLRIVWNQTAKVFFTATVDDGKIFASVASGASTITISNMALYVATEKNPTIVNDLMSKVASGGFDMLIPYVYSYKNNLTGSNVSTSLRFNRGHGKNLQKVYYAVFNGSEGKNTAYDNNNVVGTAGGGATNAGVDGACPIIQNYYTLLNNVRLQEYNMECNKWDDYKLLQSKLKGSVIQNSNIYNYNQFWVDDFCGFDKLWDENSNLNCGLDLSIEQKWDIYLTLNNNLSAIPLNHYAFAVTQKVLSVSSSGVSVL